MSKSFGVEWKRFRTKEGVPLIINEGITLCGTVTFHDEADRTRDREERLRERLTETFKYACDLLGSNPFSRTGWKFVIVKSGFYAAGVEMRIGLPALDHAKDGERTDLYASLFVHEWMHHLRDTEDLSMFAELVYLVERQGWERIKQIQDYYDHRLDPGTRFTRPYVSGFEQIARILQVEPSHVADALRTIPLAPLKRLFRAYSKAVMREEGLLPVQESSSE